MSSFFSDMFTSYTPFQEKVQACSSEELRVPDMLANIEICDAVNSSKQAAKECYEVVKKRMMSKDAGGRVALLTLELIEMLVKNCGFNFFSLVARQEFQDDLIKLVKKEKTPAVVRDKVLLLIMSWGEAFNNMKDVYPSFQQTYAYLRTDPTIEFPARDTTAMSPIFTPPVSVQTGGSAVSRAPPPPPARTQPAGTVPLPPVQASPLANESSKEYQEKLKFELQMSHNLMLMTREIISGNMSDGWIMLKNNELLNALIPKLKKIGRRLNTLLDELQTEQLLSLTIVVSEYIGQTMSWYSALVTEKPFPTPQPLLPLLEISSAESEAAAAAEEEAAGGPGGAEIDLLGLGTQGGKHEQVRQNSQSIEDDPFESLANRDANSVSAKAASSASVLPPSFDSNFSAFSVTKPNALLDALPPVISQKDSLPVSLPSSFFAPGPSQSSAASGFVFQPQQPVASAGAPGSAASIFSLEPQAPSATSNLSADRLQAAAPHVFHAPGTAEQAANLSPLSHAPGAPEVQLFAPGSVNQTDQILF